MKKDLMLGTCIAYYRKLNSLTQEELAQQIGVSCQAVSKWEQQLSCPDVMLLPSLAEAFHISIDELFGLDAKKEIIYDFVAELPWPDDGKIRLALYNGRKLLNQSTYECTDGENSIQFHFHGIPYDVNGKCKLICTKKHP